MIVHPIKTHVFEEGEDLFRFVDGYAGSELRERDVLVVTSKIVALAEGRVAVRESDQTKEELLQQESEFALRTKYAWLTIKDGSVMSSAGIDESNADGKLILLPKDAFRTAGELRMRFLEKYSLRELGVILTDTRIVSLRAGSSGVAIGYAGFRGLRDYIGKPDIFGRKLVFAKSNVADSLATAAVLVMGEGNEQQPLAIIHDAPVEFCDQIHRDELYIDPKEDLYGPIFSKF